MILGTIRDGLLGKRLAGKGVIRAEAGTITAGQDF